MRTSLRFTCVFVLVTLVAAAAPAHAALRTFLQIPGVPGESRDARHAGWIDVEGLSVGISAGACNDFVVTKYLDRASPLLSAAALTRVIYPNATIHTVRAGEIAIPFLVYTLESVAVHAVSVLQDGESLAEVVRLRPASVTTSYYPQRADGSYGDPIESTVACKYK